MAAAARAEEKGGEEPWKAVPPFYTMRGNFFAFGGACLTVVDVQNAHHAHI